MFPQEEFARRDAAVRGALAASGLDALVLSVPENIYYLTGLDHWGFFACHLLIVPAEGEMVLLCRDMERVTVEAQVRNARFVGHGDDESVAAPALRELAGLGLARGRLGYEAGSLFLTPRIADALRAGAGSDWVDVSGLVDRIRIVQSPRELDCTRRAARAAEAGMQAAIEAIRAGARDCDIAAECHRAMFAAGSEYPGFGPFIRPRARAGEEHTTWRGDVLGESDAVFLEIAAAVAKYQAPMGRLVYVGEPPAGIDAVVALAIEGMAAVCEALRPGASAGSVYAAWQAVVDAGGLLGYGRHHCGYIVGIGFPPSWTGGSMVTALAPHSALLLETGMVFHAHSWFTGTGRPDYFLSNTVALTETGAEVLTPTTPETLILR